MKTETLRSLLNAPTPPVLLHVLPEEVFAAKRIPGSRNACIYEVAFLDKVKALMPDKTVPVVVYGAGGGSRDSRVAAEALRAAGYAEVTDFSEGLAGWEASGGPLEGTGELPRPAAEIKPGRYRVDEMASVVRWTGRNLFNHHAGTVRLAGGDIVVAGNGGLESGTFSVAMETITCEDITDPAMNKLLVGHLKSADFFDVPKHPLAVFRVAKAAPLAGAMDGSPNFRVMGSLALRGVEKPLKFPLVLAADSSGKITAQAQVELDRTEFGSIYGSGRFFHFLGQHVVNDIVHLHLKVQAVPD